MLQDKEGFEGNTQAVCMEGPKSTCKSWMPFRREMMLQYRRRGLEVVCQATGGDSGHSTVSKLKIMSKMGKLVNFWWSRRKNVDGACDQR